MSKIVFKTVVLSTFLIFFISTQAIKAQDFFEISKQLELLHAVYKEIHLHYVEQPNTGNITKRAIDAMLSGLDPYSVLFTEDDIEEYRYMTTGAYGGIGLNLREINGKVRVYELYENAPAAKAGIRIGDIIYSVNGIRILKYDDKVMSLLRGSPGSSVTLEIQSHTTAQPQTLKLIRQHIQPPVISNASLLSDSCTGIIRLESFTERCAEDVKTALVQLKRRGAKRLILDLRDNPGGLLQEAVRLVNLFVSPEQLVVYTKGRNPEMNSEFKTATAALDSVMPIVVWINAHSASASEIVAGALQDLDRAVIAGERSFGKGLVQQTKTLPYNSQIKITVAKYYIPSGRCIQALDYASRNAEGVVNTVPDSLITAFKTRNGRIVYDGAGVYPDLPLMSTPGAYVVSKLQEAYCFYDFANNYVAGHPKIEKPEAFKITNAEYDAFVIFCIQRLDSILTDMDLELNTKINFKKNGIRDSISMNQALWAIKTELKNQKKSWFSQFSNDIKMALEEELIARYYFEKGKRAYRIKHEYQIQELLNVMADLEKFNSYLKPLTDQKPKRPFSQNKRY